MHDFILVFTKVFCGPLCNRVKKYESQDLIKPACFRVFVLLLAMGQKSLSGPSAVSIMESLLDMLARVLSPLMAGQSGTCTDTTPLLYLLS